jgi:hypothetical protein
VSDEKLLKVMPQKWKLLLAMLLLALKIAVELIPKQSSKLHLEASYETAKGGKLLFDKE